MRGFLVWLPLAVWATILLGYAFIRARRDRIEHRSFQEQLKASPNEH